MDAYYQAQIQSSAFSGPGRQMGSGALGAMALRMGRVTLPLLAKYVLPVVKTVGKELLRQVLPEIANVATKKKNLKRALQDASLRTIESTIPSTNTKPKKRKVIANSSVVKRRRKDLFVNVKND